MPITSSSLLTRVDVRTFPTLHEWTESLLFGFTYAATSEESATGSFTLGTFVLPERSLWRIPQYQFLPNRDLYGRRWKSVAGNVNIPEIDTKEELLYMAQSIFTGQITGTYDPEDVEDILEGLKINVRRVRESTAPEYPFRQMLIAHLAGTLRSAMEDAGIVETDTLDVSLGVFTGRQSFSSVVSNTARDFAGAFVPAQLIPSNDPIGVVGNIHLIPRVIVNHRCPSDAFIDNRINFLPTGIRTVMAGMGIQSPYTPYGIQLIWPSAETAPAGITYDDLYDPMISMAESIMDPVSLPSALMDIIRTNPTIGEDYFHVHMSIPRINGSGVWVREYWVFESEDDIGEPTALKQTIELEAGDVMNPTMLVYFNPDRLFRYTVGSRYNPTIDGYYDVEGPVPPAVAPLTGGLNHRRNPPYTGPLIRSLGGQLSTFLSNYMTPTPGNHDFVVRYDSNSSGNPGDGLGTTWYVDSESRLDNQGLISSGILGFHMNENSFGGFVTRVRSRILQLLGTIYNPDNVSHRVYGMPLTAFIMAGILHKAGLEGLTRRKNRQVACILTGEDHFVAQISLVASEIYNVQDVGNLFISGVPGLSPGSVALSLTTVQHPYTDQRPGISLCVVQTVQQGGPPLSMDVDPSKPSNGDLQSIRSTLRLIASTFATGHGGVNDPSVLDVGLIDSFITFMEGSGSTLGPDPIDRFLFDGFNVMANLTGELKIPPHTVWR